MVFSFFWAFCKLLPNKVEHTWLKSQLHVLIMSELKFFILALVLILNFNIINLINLFERNNKLCILIILVTLKMISWRTMSKERKWKKVKNQDPMGKTNFFLSTLPFSPWGVLATWLHVGAPQKIHEKWT
jgi:hypothetical protein